MVRCTAAGSVDDAAAVVNVVTVVVGMAVAILFHSSKTCVSSWWCW